MERARCVIFSGSEVVLAAGWIPPEAWASLCLPTVPVIPPFNELPLGQGFVDPLELSEVTTG